MGKIGQQVNAFSVVSICNATHFLHIYPPPVDKSDA